MDTCCSSYRVNLSSSFPHLPPLLTACYMKSACPSKTAAKATITAGVVGAPAPPPPPGCHLFPSQDCDGHDISHAPADTPGQCCALCTKTGGCSAFSHKAQDKWTVSARAPTNLGRPYPIRASASLPPNLARDTLLRHESLLETRATPIGTPPHSQGPMCYMKSGCPEKKSAESIITAGVITSSAAAATPQVETA